MHTVFQVNLMHLFSSEAGHRSQLYPQVWKRLKHAQTDWVLSKSISLQSRRLSIHRLLRCVLSVPGHRSLLHPRGPNALPGHAGGSPVFVAQQQSSRNRLSADALSLRDGCLKLKPCQKPSIRSPNMVSRSDFWMTHAEEQQSTVARTSMKGVELGLLTEHHV